MHTLELLGITSKAQAFKEVQYYLVHAQNSVHVQWQSPQSHTYIEIGNVVTLRSSLFDEKQRVQVIHCAVYDKVVQYKGIVV